MKKEHFCQISFLFLWYVFFLWALINHFISPVRQYSSFFLENKGIYHVLTGFYLLALAGPAAYFLWRFFQHKERGFCILCLLLCVIGLCLGSFMTYTDSLTSVSEITGEITYRKYYNGQDGCTLTVLFNGQAYEVLCSYEDYCRIQSGTYQMSVIQNPLFPGKMILDGLNIP